VRDLQVPEDGQGIGHPAILSPGRHNFTMAVLSDAEVEARLSEHPGWERRGPAIAKVFEQGDFVGSVRFAERLIAPAESMNHHPDLEISWDKVTVTLSTHSEGGVTSADFELAGKIDAIA
jgi:4a-hydroxytetrahydrobiopterin dehydratase